MIIKLFGYTIAWGATQIDRQIDRQIDNWKDTQIDRQLDRQIDRQIDSWLMGWCKRAMQLLHNYKIVSTLIVKGLRIFFYCYIFYKSYYCYQIKRGLCPNILFLWFSVAYFILKSLTYNVYNLACDLVWQSGRVVERKIRNY